MRTDAWRDIRALRAILTGMAAAHAKRSATFRAALRQAEELAFAANAAGHASSALPLFYAVEHRKLCMLFGPESVVIIRNGRQYMH